MNNEIILDQQAVAEVKKVIGGGGDAPDSLAFGTLTETEEYIDTNIVLNSSLSYSDILDAHDNGKTVILQYAEIPTEEGGLSNYYYYAINDAQLFEGKYIFNGKAFKQSEGLGGYIKWDYEEQTFAYNDGTR